LNELLNYFLYIVGYFTEGKIILNTKNNDILLYIVLPIIYQVLIIILTTLFQNKIKNPQSEALKKGL